MANRTIVLGRRSATTNRQGLNAVGQAAKNEARARLALERAQAALAALYRSALRDPLWATTETIGHLAAHLEDAAEVAESALTTEMLRDGLTVRARD